MNPVLVNKSPDKRRLPLEGTVLVAHQVECLPYLGNISKATMGDVYLLYDNAQFVKKHWQNKNKIRVKNKDGFHWLTIPVHDVNKHLIKTNEVRITRSNWREHHLKAIELAYKKAPYFHEIFDDLIKLYSYDGDLLVEFLLSIVQYAFRKFNVRIPVYLASDLIKKGYYIDGNKSELIINMCKVFNANVFVFGVDGRTYIDKETFYKNNIKFVFQNFQHPVYNQIHGDFIPFMSFIDLLFNCGPNSIEVLGKSNYLEK